MSGFSGEEILGDFMKEVQGYIPGLEKGLARLHEDPEEAREMHRLVHIIKGASAMLGLKKLSKAADCMETALERIMEGETTATAPLIAAMTATVARFNQFCTQAPGGPLDEDRLLRDTLGDFEGLTNGDRSGPPPPDKEGNGPETDPAPADEMAGIDDLLSLEAGGAGPSSEPDALFSPPDLDVPEPDALFESPEPDLPGPDALFRDGETGKKPELPADQPALPPEIMDDFLQEAEEHLEEVAKNLNQLESRFPNPGAIGDADREVLRRIRRSVHTVKGASAVVGLDAVSGWAHKMEDLLDWLYESAKSLDPECLTVLQQASDLLEGLISRPGDVNESRRQTLGQSLEQCMTETGADPLSTVAPEEPPKPEPERPKSAAPASRPSRTLRVGVDRLDDLANLAGELLIAVSAFEQKLFALTEAMEDVSGTRFRLEDSYRRLEKGFDVKALGKTVITGAPAAPGPPAASAAPDPFLEFDDMELERYSELNLIIRNVGESVVDVGALSGHLSGLYSEFDGSLNRQRVLLGELQEKLLQLRMTPMATVANRFRRTVRDAAFRVGKKVAFTVAGEDIELDRAIWEKMSDPIMHLLRNAVDHGIEDKKTRLAAGKPPTGNLFLSAARQGNQVVLEITDDGGGLDHEAIREKVRAMNLAPAPDQLGPDDLAAFIFHPGLSTKKDVSQLSGRGVGMDVVRKNIQDLKGFIRVSSKSGAGMRMVIRIPLTLAVVRALIFKVKDRVFALALNEIAEILRIDSADITVHPEKTVPIGDEILPVIYLDEVFQLSGPDRSPDDHPLVLVVQTGGAKAAVVVDALLGQREIVVKSLGSHLTYVRGISGATILGDGSVVPILDLADILSFDRTRVSAPAVPVGEGEPSDLDVRIMVVDDSVSVREVVSRHIRARGWIPVKAKDGRDALLRLETPPLPRLILLDVEMPRMNGYEFLQAVASDPALSAIPKVMLTSRVSEKHRKRAMELGAVGYIPKPYTEKELMDIIAQYAGLENGD